MSQMCVLGRPCADIWQSAVAGHHNRSTHEMAEYVCPSHSPSEQINLVHSSVLGGSNESGSDLFRVGGSGVELNQCVLSILASAIRNIHCVNCSEPRSQETAKTPRGNAIVSGLRCDTSTVPRRDGYSVSATTPETAVGLVSVPSIVQ